MGWVPGPGDKAGTGRPAWMPGGSGSGRDPRLAALLREVTEETGLVIRDPIFLTDAVDHEGDGRLVSLFYACGPYRPEDIDLHEGAGVAVHRMADLADLKVTPFVQRAIESHLLPLIMDVGSAPF